MTMSLSVARPIVAEPSGCCSAPDREGSNAWIIFVARFETDTSGGLTALGAIWVCGAGDAATPHIPGRTSDGAAGMWSAVAASWSGTQWAAAGRRWSDTRGCPGAPGCGRGGGGAAQFAGRPGGPGRAVGERPSQGLAVRISESLATPSRMPRRWASTRFGVGAQPSRGAARLRTSAMARRDFRC